MPASVSGGPLTATGASPISSVDEYAALPGEGGVTGRAPPVTTGPGLAGAAGPTGTVVTSVISPARAGSAGPVSLSAANVPAAATSTNATTVAANTAGRFPAGSDGSHGGLGMLRLRGACSITSGSS